MLSVFPELLTYGFFAPMLLRQMVGLYMIGVGIVHFERAKEKRTLPVFWFWSLGVGELIVGALLIVGVWTQLAAIAAALYSIKMLAFRNSRFSELVLNDHFVYIFTLAISLSLLITGAGAFAIDLPF